MNLMRNARRSALLTGLLALAAVAAVACGDDAVEDDTAGGDGASAATGSMTIADAWARETAGNPGENTAIYAQITNGTGQDDTLIGAVLPEGMAMGAEVHEMVPSGANMLMQEIEGGLALPAGETVGLEPGGYHVMVMGLTERLIAGDHIHVTFVFAHAGEVEMTVDVRDAAAGAGGMSGMGH